MRHERLRSGIRVLARRPAGGVALPHRRAGRRVARRPRAVGAGAALLTAALDCDTNGLVVIVAAAAAGPAGAWAWAAWRRAGGRLLAASVIGACLLTPVVGAAAWATVALDRCFTF